MTQKKECAATGCTDKCKEGTVEVIIRKHALKEAPTDKHFIVADGNKIKSVAELACALETMSEEVFKHHVNEARNDFASWINDVFDEKNLAAKIAAAKDKATHELVLLKNLVTMRLSPEK